MCPHPLLLDTLKGFLYSFVHFDTHYVSVLLFVHGCAYTVRIYITSIEARLRWASMLQRAIDGVSAKVL